MNKKGILEKVSFMLTVSKNKKYTPKELNEIISFTHLHSNERELGKVFGYSVSDYAYATLFWLGTSETLNIYNSMSSRLSEERIKEIDSLIQSKLYEQC